MGVQAANGTGNGVPQGAGLVLRWVGPGRD